MPSYKKGVSALHQIWPINMPECVSFGAPVTSPWWHLQSQS